MAAAAETAMLVVTAATAKAAEMAEMKIRFSSKPSPVTRREAPHSPPLRNFGLARAGYGVRRLPYLCDRLRLMSD